MKASKSKTSSSNLQPQNKQASKPFFEKGGEGTFFSEASNDLQTKPFFSPSTIQTKLKIGQPNDKYEQEADAMADTVMTKLAQPKTASSDAATNNPATRPGIQTSTCTTCGKEEQIQKKDEEQEELSLKEETIQRKSIFESNDDPEEDTVQRMCADCAEKEQVQKMEQPEEEMVQEKSESDPSPASPDLENQLNASKGGGSPLPKGTQESMGSAFGADFSEVKIHTDSNAVEMNKSLGAHAFAHGSDIYFNEGKYDTSSSDGNKLLAHELTHTVQQGGAVQRKSISTTSEPVIQRGAIEWIKGKIADGLNWLVEKIIPGYSLLNVILGKNLITGRPVDRSGVNIIKGYMELLPVIGSILFNELRETESLNEAGVWVEGQVAKFGVNFDDISKNLNLFWEEASIWNSKKTNAAIFKKYIGPWLNKFLNFSGVVNEKVKALRLEGALRFVGAHELLGSLKKSPAAMKKVIENPKIIFKYFIDALKQGFQSFKTNFGKHFKNALFGWLFGKAAEMGITMPKKMNIAGLFGLIAQLLGATYQQIRAIVVKKLGPKGESIISKLEKTAEIVIDFMTKGPAALWERVKGFLVNLKETIFTKITELVTGEIIKSAVTKLVSMLNPAGAIVQLAMTIYRVVKYFIDWWDTIKDIASGILSTITKVALGSIGGAAKFIENLFGKGMKLIIAFLARIFGLGGIAEKVKLLIKKISAPVQMVIGKVVGWIVEKGKALFGKLTGKGKDKKKLDNDPKRAAKIKAGLNAINQGEKKYLTGGKISQEESKKVAVDVKKKHPVFKSINVIDGGKKWDYIYKMDEDKHSTESDKEESRNERINKMDDGSLSIKQREVLLAKVEKIINNSVVVENLFKISKAKDIIDLFNGIVERNLQNGYKIVMKPQSDIEINLSYKGLFYARTGIKYGTVKVGLGRDLGRMHAGQAELQGELLKLNLNVDSKVKRMGVKGVGTTMFDMAAKHFQGKFSELEGLWVKNEALYKTNPEHKSDNLITFWKKVNDEKLSLENAAWATFTGRLAKKQLYNHVKVHIAEPDMVRVVFSKKVIINEG